MRDHRNLLAWQEARIVSRLVLQAVRIHWAPWKAPYFSQLQRSSVSVHLNIAEGSTFGPGRTYARYLGIAYGSAVETGDLVEFAAEEKLLPPDDAYELLSHSDRSQRLLLGLLKHHRPMK